jgi:hypothetical protein
VAEQLSASILIFTERIFDSITFYESYFGRCDRGIGFPGPAGVKKYFSLHSAQTSSGAHPASYRMRSAGIFMGEESGRGVKLTIHFNLMSQIRMVELYLHYPLRLQGLFLN